MYKHWKADSNVMMRDAILANKVGISYPRQLELIHGAIERILKSLIIRKYGLEVPVHETRVIIYWIGIQLKIDFTLKR